MALVALFLMGVATYLFRELDWQAALLLGSFGLLLGLLFYRLRVAVDDSHLHLVFGVGLVRRSIARADIVGAAAMRNRFWYGWGIRRTPHGWMWNISGLDAVEITYASGKKFRIGTDEPGRLLQALGY
ncbi:MAG: hypothetical protein CL960_00125 [Euryarchaeota archaeon]|nr:hypothetical protein [Euryarchaeota archaeon]